MKAVIPAAAAAPAVRRRPRRPLWAIPIVAAAIVALLAIRNRAARPAAGQAPSLPMVATLPVVRRDLYNELSIQAEFRPYQEVELHAKVSGYLQRIEVDFGDRVKTGELIATLEVPELKDDMEHAVAAEQRAEADYRDAHLGYTRLQEVNRSQPNLVAQQDLDAATARDGIAAATLAEAKSEQEKYRTLWDYTRITAPFSGVVTQRYADPGALIQAGTSGQAQPLIRLSQNDRLRLDFPISVSYASQIAVGDSVEIRLEGGARNLRGTIARFSRRIATDTRTMETEVEVPNPDLKLIPGMYAAAVLQMQRRPGALAVPVEAVSGGQPPTVYVVGPDGRLEERALKLGIETPGYYEVLSGLSAGEQVMVGSRAGVAPGQKVAVKAMAASAAL
ncbi:MAG TPA: efflux RND transporter periplasmic adaptor subunit [Opitutaceae bacterium]|nr:efflux RND transporter periplasmic adaptor subunit [Opitutaceae bacterium]